MTLNLNINVLNKKNSAYLQLYNTLNDYGLSIIGTLPTRITLMSSTHIDLVICNSLAKPFINSYQSITTGISDHNTLIFGYKKLKTPKKPPKVVKQSIMNIDALHVIKLGIRNINICMLLNKSNIDDSIHEFMKEINDLIKINTTNKVRKVSSIQHPWITPYFIKCCQDRDKFFQIANRNNSPTLLANAKLLRNKCTALSRTLKRNYIANNLNIHKNNPKKVWEILRPFYTDKVSNSNIDKLLVDNIIITAPLLLADYFISFFVDSVLNLHNKFLPSVPHNHAPPVQYPIFNFTAIDHTTITPIINKIKSHGRSEDSIHTKLLVFCIEEFSIYFSQIINQIFLACDFPKQWKQAEVVPIHKGGSKLDVVNYRPISILPNTSKIIERVMHNQITHFINQHDILPPCQHGFRSHHSTTTCLVDFFNFVNSNLASGKHVMAVYIDFSKAFDLLSHDVLLEKLKWLNFSHQAIRLIKSYLHGRTQRVYSIGVFSRLVEIILGVPQGSILGPLLFAIYIFDMPYCIKHAAMFPFADDSTLVIAHKNINVLLRLLNDDIVGVESYCNSNKIFIN